MTSDVSQSFAAMKLVVDTVIQQLECPVCMDTCTMPIFMCTNGHNICPSCQPQVEECPVCRAPGMPLIRNISMEAVCGQVLLPCKFKKAGCKIQLKYKELEAHKANCYFRYECLIGDCKWFGNIAHIADHVEEEHPVNKAGTNSYRILSKVFDTKEDIWVQTLMNDFHTALFWFNYRFNLAELKFYFYCQYIGPDVNATKYIFEFSLLTPDRSIANSHAAPALTLDEDYKVSQKTFVLSKEQAEKFFTKDGTLLYRRRLLFNK